MILRFPIEPSALDNRRIRHNLQLSIQAGPALTAKEMLVDFPGVAGYVPGLGAALFDAEARARHNHVGGVG